MPAYDAWFDDYARRRGDEHDVKVAVDHIPFGQVAIRAEGDVSARGPHDIFGFVDPPPVFEDDVIDHRDIVVDLEAKRTTSSRGGRSARSDAIFRAAGWSPKLTPVW